ncbi:mediator complex, subunit Med22 [Phyllosticta citricarpa]
MDVSQRNAAALQERVMKLATALVKRFENIVALASPDAKDFNTTASKKFQMEVETAALIRATEDILTLTRQMQELWLFGQLNTVDKDGKAKEISQVEEDARAIAAAVEQLAKETL